MALFLLAPNIIEYLMLLNMLLLTCLQCSLIFLHYAGGNAEKSHNAQCRELETKKKFDSYRLQMETAMAENTINELRESESTHPIKLAPTILMNNIFGYVFGPKYKGKEVEEDTFADAPPAAAASSSMATTTSSKRGRARKAVNYSELNIEDSGHKSNKKASKKGAVEKKDLGESGIDFAEKSLYEPGSKIVIPLAKPNFHLAGPCFRGKCHCCTPRNELICCNEYLYYD